MVRRCIALAIIIGFAYGIFHLLFRTDVLAPVIALAAPIESAVAWVSQNPVRAWGALAVIVIPHIGLYYLIFEDR